MSSFDNQSQSSQTSITTTTTTAFQAASPISFPVLLKNEILAPDILPYNQTMMENSTFDMENLAKIIKQLEKKMSNSETESKLDPEVEAKISVYRMNLRRIKYCTRRYLQIRLLKIEKYFRHLKTLDNPTLDSMLSEEEKVYLENYYKLEHAHVETMVISKLPESVRDWDQEKMIEAPNVNQLTYFKVRESMGKIEINEFCFLFSFFPFNSPSFDFFFKKKTDKNLIFNKEM